jgi:hypothetical protein
VVNAQFQIARFGDLALVQGKLCLPMAHGEPVDWFLRLQFDDLTLRVGCVGINALENSPIFLTGGVLHRKRMPC